MIRKILSILAASAASILLCAATSYDLVVVGGTPGGIMTAISAAREGCNVLILERTNHIGGLPANGLGATDITTRGATTGLFLEFTERNYRHYLQTYGPDSDQVRDCSGGYHFEPSVAEQTLLQMIAVYSDKITVLLERQFDSDPANVIMNGRNVESIRVVERTSGKIEEYSAAIFIDATYEGDLGAAAGIPYRIGREGRSEFGEPCAGKIYRHWGVQFDKGEKQVYNGFEGYESAGTTYLGDNAVQAYNYRLCLTADKKQQTPVTKPAGYNRDEYASLVEDVWTGRNTGIGMESVTAEMMEANREALKKGGKTRIPGDPWGMAKVTNMVPLPNGKTDANNQHMAFVSTDLPEENWPWPTASWEWRDKFAQRLKDYTLGLLWFVQHDSQLPEQFRKECQRWGLSSTEYVDNGNFPRQVYVREGRRLEGTYLFTANDAIPVTYDRRPPVHRTSITASHYALDSHAALKREEGKVHLDGFFGYESKPYTVPLGVMIPRQISNLIFPVPVSGTHVGFSTMRMEPCWMALGEAAGIAAAQAVRKRIEVQQLDSEDIQKTLVAHKATLIYYYDIDCQSEEWEMVQMMGVKGYLPGWKADLDSAATAEDLSGWRRLSGIDIPEGMKKRREVLTYIYSKIR